MMSKTGAKMDKKNSVEPITEELFREAYQFEEPRKQPLKRVIVRRLKCNKSTAMNLFPISKWLINYSIKKELIGDTFAGITVAVMHIPHGLAYAPLGGVQPVVGFYMAVFPVFIYMIMGTSRHLSLGTFAVVCAMVGRIVSTHEIRQDEPRLEANSSNSNATEAPVSGPRYEAYEVACAVCLLVGLWQAVLGLLRLGFLTVVMSESLVAGFTTGAAIHVMSYQLKNLFGVNVAAFFGVLKLFHIYIDFFSKINTVNVATLYISVTCIATLLVVVFVLNPFLKKRFPKNRVPFPIELIVIVVGILVSYFAHLSEKYNVKIVGHIPTGLPAPMFPPFSLFPYLLRDTFIVAVVSLAVSLSLAKIFAKRGDYIISSNQELLAYGFANIFASFFRCLPASASLSRSSIQFSVGGKTQLSSIFTMSIILVLLLVAGPLFQPVPYCVLSSIVVVSLMGLLLQIRDLPRVFRESYMDGCVWLGTFLAVVILDLDYGLGVGILLSFASMLFSAQRLQVAVMGRVPDTNIYLKLDYFKAARVIPNVHILQVTGTMNFANKTTFEHKLMKEIQDFKRSPSEDESSIIISMAGVPRIDPSAVHLLKQLHKDFKKFRCNLYLADCNFSIYKTFQTCDFFEEFPKERVLASLPDAVEYATSQSEGQKV